MQATAFPNPFSASSGFNVNAGGGTPPFTGAAFPSPPNPPGVQVTQGTPIHVSVPEDTPMGTRVWILVCDQSNPPQTAMVSSTVG